MLEEGRYLDRSPVAHGTRCAKTNANLAPTVVDGGGERACAASGQRDAFTAKDLVSNARSRRGSS